MVQPLQFASDESELTDLSSEEESVDLDEAPRKSTRSSTQEATLKSKARTNGTFPPQALEACRTTTYQALALYDKIKKGQIDLNPEYQRGVVWNEAKQSSLINSIYHNFHTPQIIFNVVKIDDYTKVLKCIDGKQRLTSLFRFFEGEIPIKPHMNNASSPLRNRKYWFKKDGNSKNRTLMPAGLAVQFEGIQIACVEYTNLKPELEREIFQRVQFGVPLAPADRLPAINGPWADLVRELRDRINTTEGFEGYLHWGKERGRDFQAVAQVVYLAVHGSNPRKAEPTPSRVESFLHSSDGKPATLRPAIMSALDIFCRIAQTPDIAAPLAVELSPMDFVLAAYVIYLQRTRLTDRQLSEVIWKMRNSKRLGTVKQDTKSKKITNFKRILDFILKAIPALINEGKLIRTNKGEKPAAAVPYERVECDVDRFKYNVYTDDDDQPSGYGAGGKSMGGKRKRIDTLEDEKEDGGDIVKAPTKKAKNKIDGQQASTSKLKSRSKDDSRAKTTVKKTPQKKVSDSSAISASARPTQVSSAGPSRSGQPKLDEQVAKQSVRPPPAMAIPSTNFTSAAVEGSTKTAFPISKPPLPGRTTFPASYWQSQTTRTEMKTSKVTPTTPQTALVCGWPASQSNAADVSDTFDGPSRVGRKYSKLKINKKSIPSRSNQQQGQSPLAETQQSPVTDAVWLEGLTTLCSPINASSTQTASTIPQAGAGPSRRTTARANPRTSHTGLYHPVPPKPPASVLPINPSLSNKSQSVQSFSSNAADLNGRNKLVRNNASPR